MSFRSKCLVCALAAFIGLTVTAMGAQSATAKSKTKIYYRIVGQASTVEAIAASIDLTVEDMIMSVCEGTSVDPVVAVAISMHETGRWTSAAYVDGNNVGGLSVNEVPLSYESLQEGVKAFIECLETYFDKGLTTPEQIEPIYCPSSHGEWAVSVRALMEEITNKETL